MTEDWDAELGTEPVAIIPSFNDMAGLMNEDINGNQSFDLKGSGDGNGFNTSDRNIFGKSGFGKQQGFTEAATGNKNEFDRRGGRRCGFGRGDRAGFPRVGAQNVAVKASGDGPFGRGGSLGRGAPSERGGFGGQSGDSGGFGLNRGRTGFQLPLATRGGYKGRNEEPFSGSTSKLAGHWKSGDVEGDKSQGPKVTYVPPPPPEDESTIFSRYQTGINFDKYDDILVDVSGFNVPPAILSFDEAHLCETLNKNINKAGYLKPTPVQKHGIPIVLSGRDLMACAQTGSGKTAAFLLPIIEMLLRGNAASSRFKELQEPEVVIVAPTRELINQIYLEARKFSYGTVVRPVVVYGGTSTGHQIRQVLQGCNILCGTPGRLLDIISKGKVGLGKVQYLVLDEADRMLDMGFEPDMRKLVNSFNMPPKQNRQTLMFSATFPEEIQRLAADFMKSDYLFLAVGQVGGACGDVQQSILQVDQYSKRNKLVEILTNIGIERTMVFVDTKRKADFLATFLCQEKFPTTSIHGDREQREREIALGDFRTGKCPVLVATAVAARGLDIEHVQHVINFDLPSTIDEYVHRIGRTGRCGNVGKAISFFDSNTDLPIARALLKVLSDAQQEVPIWLEEFAYAAHGTSYHNPLGKVFASVDTRKGLGVNRNFSGYETNIPVTHGGNSEDTWD
ncbi:probable ATP-dependent RNA helicase DDX4 [Stegostoma tigrinum]|uniref:probable ATP-dependent RNA helicase DDX4 n=1 Tax=Stegostoma tigrinum TaxID=3053191 RepID=UPI00287001F5|nr:probable ATP-dependent RNA helicase DDX4 [Stegostoma tigrinum]XP_059504403.1 probable ATP-dependent RNA helicase DDX4 [Stegostoma tigrinum]XP_059504413.1 probable ATP-dependent RNA helicase DDX4 [Stegostoma tigrinum]XP_059504420.1 probable ATP-dependent RNA helicase DDX4 [Stegostoma tigrinum]XP_059504421.1 probable ATP-dependent RNA helicase DDX4 [Stegostoma tigrinum]